MPDLVRGYCLDCDAGESWEQYLRVVAGSGGIPALADCANAERLPAALRNVRCVMIEKAGGVWSVCAYYRESSRQWVEICGK